MTPGQLIKALREADLKCYSTPGANGQTLIQIEDLVLLTVDEVNLEKATEPLVWVDLTKMFDPWHGYNLRSPSGHLYPTITGRFDDWLKASWITSIVNIVAHILNGRGVCHAHIGEGALAAYGAIPKPHLYRLTVLAPEWRFVRV